MTLWKRNGSVLFFSTVFTLTIFNRCIESNRPELPYESDIPRVIRQVQHSESVSALSWSPDGKWLVSGGRDCRAVVWEPETGKVVRSFDCGKYYVYATDISTDGRYLATASDSVRIWDILNGSLIHDLPFSNARGQSVAFSPNSKWLAYCDQERVVRIWDILLKKHVIDLENNHMTIDAVAFSSDGSRIAGAGPAGYGLIYDTIPRQLRIWDITTGKQILVDRWRSREGVQQVKFSPDDCFILTSGKILIRNSITGNRLLKEYGNSDSIDFLSDSQQIAIGTTSRGIMVIDLLEGSDRFQLNTKSGRADRVALSPSGRLIAGAEPDGLISIWKIPTVYLQNNSNKSLTPR